MLTREQRILQFWAHKLSAEYGREAVFLAKAKEFVEMFDDCVVVREATATVSGVADLLLCYRGRFIAAELKRIGGTPSPQQLKFIDKVNAAGGRAAVCKNLKDIHRLMQDTATFP